jgi:uncharacterized Ntn-hydrolase superfamily protein
MHRLLLAAAAALPLLAADINTFSIVGYDAATGECGIAVASRYFSVGAAVPWAEAGVGCVATQANVNVGYGTRGLELLRQGLTAQQALDKLLSEDTFPGKDGRQVAIIDAKGNVVTYTAPNAPNWAGGKKGANWAAQGNILVGPQVPEAMGKAFESTAGDLPEKLFAALKAGDDAGGDSRGKQSASMLVVGKGGKGAAAISITIGRSISMSTTVRLRFPNCGGCWTSTRGGYTSSVRANCGPRARCAKDARLR